jgi:hypothetical protein
MFNFRDWEEVLNRVETKIFIVVFSRKFIFAFCENFLTKIMHITKVFAKIFVKFLRKLKKVGFLSYKAGVFTYLRSLEKEFFSLICLSVLHILIGHVRTALDSQDKTVRTGQSVSDFEDRAPRTGHVGQDR